MITLLHVLGQQTQYINLQSTELFNFNFQSLKVVSRKRDPQLQVTENMCDLWNLSPNTYQCFKIWGIFYL